MLVEHGVDDLFGADENYVSASLGRFRGAFDYLVRTHVTAHRIDGYFHPILLEPDEYDECCMIYVSSRLARLYLRHPVRPGTVPRSMSEPRWIVLHSNTFPPKAQIVGGFPLSENICPVRVAVTQRHWASGRAGPMLRGPENSAQARWTSPG